MFKINLPLSITYGKRKPKKYYLNLNVYRNTAFIVLNQRKADYEKLIHASIAKLPSINQVELTYRLFPATKREIDISNVCCIVDKFFSDTLVNAGKLTDDSMNHVKSVKYEWGGVDRENPRVEVSLNVLELNKDETVRLVFTHDEIKQALLASAAHLIKVPEGMELGLKAAISDKGEMYAEVILGSSVGGTISPAPVEPEEEEETEDGGTNEDGSPKPRRRRRTKAEMAAARAAEEAAARGETPVLEAQAETPVTEEQSNETIIEQASEAAAEIAAEVEQPAPSGAAPASVSGGLFASVGSSKPPEEAPKVEAKTTGNIFGDLLSKPNAS
jgi:hypothetical protein